MGPWAETWFADLLLLAVSGLWIDWLFDLQRYSAATKFVSIQLEEAILETFNVAN